MSNILCIDQKSEQPNILTIANFMRGESILLTANQLIHEGPHSFDGLHTLVFTISGYSYLQTK